MTYKIRATYSAKKLLCRTVLVAALVVGAPFASAQEEGEGKGVLVPNLTVNIKLNSALDEKETEFYSKIAQDLISKLPRELSVDKQAGALKDLDEAYKHLNVVTYLPPTDDVETDKLIKHFKVRFVFDDQDGAKSAEEVEDIILPKALQGENVVGLKDPDTNEGEAGARPSMIDQMVQNQDPEPAAAKPAPVVVPQPAPKPAVVAAVTPKPAPKPKAAAPKSKANKLRLAFDTDETVLNVKQRQETMKFIEKLRSQGTKTPDGFVFVVRSYEGPIGVEDNLGESRLRSVTALLRQQDINVSRSRVTEIFVRTNEQQFVEVEPVY